MPETKINVLFMEEAENFIRSLSIKAQKKIVYNINRVRGGEMDKELFKKLGDSEIWEFRTLFNGIKYRLLAFWDTEENSIVVTTHGFIKKTSKTPQKEIERAKKLRREYFTDKED